MGQKSNLLIITDYNRKDYIDLLYSCRNFFNIYFLYYTSHYQLENKYHETYGKCLFWKDFHDAFDLLDSIKPAKVIFFQIESFNETALNIACKEWGVATYLLEHGLRADYVLGFSPAISPPPPVSFRQKLLTKLKLLRNIKDRMQSRLFLLNSIKKFSGEDAAFLRHFIRIRRKHNYLDTFRFIQSTKRLAQSYISFSPRIFKIHQTHDALPVDYKVHFIGVPYFDHLANLKSAKTDRAILLIDQPLAEQGLLQWTKRDKTNFAESVLNICSHHNYKLYIKPHPRQEIELWARAEQNGLCEIINNEQLLALAPRIPVVVGFYSTLLMPFAAFEHTVLVTYENHPAGDYVVSKPFVEAGVAHPIYNLEELHSILEDVEALHQKQLPHKAKFTEEWMYKFDGKAGERLRDILLHDNL